MTYRYAVLGAGRQGTAAAYDMGKFGDAESVTLFDSDLSVAREAAQRVNLLLEKDVALASQIDVSNSAELTRALEGIDSFLSAVPYWLNPHISRCAIQAGASMTDLGGKTSLVLEQMKMDREAAEAGVSIVPDCGQVPGLGNSLAAYAISILDEAEEIYMWDGGIAQNPRPPFNYFLTFNIAGLTNEYYGTACFLRDGEITELPTFTDDEYELVEFPEPIGTLEAFVAGGGTSTAPWTYKSRLKTYQNKTLRYQGHFNQWKTLIDCGLLEEDPVELDDGTKVQPRRLLHAVLEPKLAPCPEDKDLVIVRIKGFGKKDGRRAEAFVEVIDYYDEKTGFTAMERTTGWHASIMAIFNARGTVPRGVKSVETAVPASKFIEELRRRGIPLEEKITYL